MATSRGLADSLRNLLDYLIEAELALYTNDVLVTPGLVTFSRHHPEAAFLLDREHPGVKQYLAWITSGSYSAVLPDASLLQMSYTFDGNRVVGHRLAYLPCPYAVDQELLAAGEPIADVVQLAGDLDYLMRTPLRFDFDLEAAKPGHPAAHLTLNGADCRIACVAPLHPLRFADFVFRNFYPQLWRVHRPFFEPAPSRHLTPPIISDADREGVHLAWDVRTSASA